MRVERLFEDRILSPGTPNLVKDPLLIILLRLTVVASLRRWHVFSRLRNNLHCGSSVGLRSISLKCLETVCKKKSITSKYFLNSYFYWCRYGFQKQISASNLLVSVTPLRARFCLALQCY